MIKTKCIIVFPVLACSFILSISIVSYAGDNNQITKKEKELDHRDDIKIVTFYKNKQKILDRVIGKTLIRQKIYYKDSPVAQIICALNRKMEELEYVDIKFFPPPDISVHIFSEGKSSKKTSKIPVKHISIEKRDESGEIINMFKVENKIGMLVPLTEKEIEEVTP